MPKLLFLCHRLPYPPNKGDKIRSFHILSTLARHYSIALGTFIDDAEDEQHVAAIVPFCAEVCVVRINPRQRRLRSLFGLLTGRALSVEYYNHPDLHRWVESITRNFGAEFAFAYSSTMAQYMRGLDPAVTRIIDFVDVDSEKWRAYAAAKPWPMSYVYRREWKRLGQYERGFAASGARCVFVSESEAALFNSLLDARSPNVFHVDNGVDLGYFDAAANFSNPYTSDRRVIVFTGAMDYWANVDAVDWFVSRVFPQIKVHVAAAEFWIVGARPTGAVKALSGVPGVHVTGTVEDIRPYLKHACVAVAPMRIARGVQNKVLEAMAMRKAVIGTTAAFEGLRLPSEYAPMVIDDPEIFAVRCIELLRGNLKHDHSVQGHHYVERRHDWDRNMQKLLALLH